MHYLTNIDLVLASVCTVIDHRLRHNVERTKKYAPRQSRERKMNDVERYFSSWTLTLQSYKQYVIESILKYQSSFLCSSARLFTLHYVHLTAILPFLICTYVLFS